MANRRAPGGGRPAKPSALKVLHGDYEKDPQKRLTAEPKPKTGRPPRPEHIKGVAQDAWERLANLLSDTGVLTVDCGPALEQYAMSYQLMRKAFDHVEEHGMVLVKTDAQGNKHPVRNPHSVELREHGSTCIKLLVEFGLTPSSRTRVQLQEELDDKAELARKYLT